MTTTPPTGQQLVAEVRAELDRPGPAHFTRPEIRALVGELDRLASELGRVRAELAREVRQHGQTIDDRDHATDMADKLASAIAPETVIGEHSGMNDPWQNALDHAAEQQTPAASPSA